MVFRVTSHIGRPSAHASLAFFRFYPPPGGVSGPFPPPHPPHHPVSVRDCQGHAATQGSVGPERRSVCLRPLDPPAPPLFGKLRGGVRGGPGLAWMVHSLGRCCASVFLCKRTTVGFL